MRTNDPSVYFKDDPNLTLYVNAYSIMTQCLNTACRIVQPSFPRAERPKVFIFDDAEPNATTTEDNEIEVNKGLLTALSTMIDTRYSDTRLRRFKILERLPGATVRKEIRAFAWRFILMHELYHLWHAHDLWETLYKYDDNGNMVELFVNAPKLHTKRGECVRAMSDSLTPERMESAITCQALELDADSCAVSMIINFMFAEYDGRQAAGQVLDKTLFLSENTTMLVAALSAAFCTFDGNRGAQFDKLLDDDEFYYTHPIPAIRMYYAEEIMDAMLWKHLNDKNTVAEIERLWVIVDSEMESETRSTFDWRNTFLFPAYTNKAQRHLCTLKRRLNDMHDSIGRLATANMQEKLAEEDLSYSQEAVAFTDQGESLRGW